MVDLIKRDPNYMNSYIDLDYDGVLAEPKLTHSNDYIWQCSFKCFECGKILCYKLLTCFCGLCIGLSWGFSFGCIAFVIIWFYTPCIRIAKVCLHPAEKSLAIFFSAIFGPYMKTLGLIFSRIHVISTTKRLHPNDNQYKYRVNSPHNEYLITSVTHTNEPNNSGSRKTKHSKDKSIKSRNDLLNNERLLMTRSHENNFDRIKDIQTKDYPSIHRDDATYNESVPSRDNKTNFNENLKNVFREVLNHKSNDDLKIIVKEVLYHSENPSKSSRSDRSLFHRVQSPINNENLLTINFNESNENLMKIAKEAMSHSESSAISHQFDKPLFHRVQSPIKNENLFTKNLNKSNENLTQIVKEVLDRKSNKNLKKIFKEVMNLKANENLKKNIKEILDHPLNYHENKLQTITRINEKVLFLPKIPAYSKSNPTNYESNFKLIDLRNQSQNQLSQTNPILYEEFKKNTIRKSKQNPRIWR